MEIDFDKYNIDYSCDENEIMKHVNYYKETTLKNRERYDTLTAEYNKLNVKNNTVYSYYTFIDHTKSYKISMEIKKIAKYQKTLHGNITHFIDTAITNKTNIETVSTHSSSSIASNSDRASIRSAKSIRSISQSIKSSRSNFIRNTITNPSMFFRRK